MALNLTNASALRHLHYCIPDSDSALYLLGNHQSSHSGDRQKSACRQPVIRRPKRRFFYCFQILEANIVMLDDDTALQIPKKLHPVAEKSRRDTASARCDDRDNASQSDSVRIPW
jgi:hypothetical protein